ncbi:hypothetical protein [Rothia halotolerans]|nr:hypothetical protein [Rothia halotolerans]
MVARGRPIARDTSLTFSGTELLATARSTCTARATDRLPLVAVAG